MEEEYFDEMDINLDLSFLHPEDSPLKIVEVVTESDKGGRRGSIAVDSEEIAVRDMSYRKSDQAAIDEVKTSEVFPPENGKSSNSVPTASLATWTFNKRKRKRVYVSLTGQKFSGPEAIKQCREG